MTAEHTWNWNIFCVDAEEETLKLYQDVLTTSSHKIASITQKYCQTSQCSTEDDANYTVFPALSGKAAVRTALEVKNDNIDLAVGFFDISMEGEISGVECIREVKRIFPAMLCAVVTDLGEQEVSNLRNLFDSQDEWLFIKKPFSTEELLQTACNLIVSWNLREEQKISMEKIKDSKERVQRLLIVTPKLFRQQSYLDLCESVVQEAADIMNTEHACLAMKKNDDMKYMAGIGKYQANTEEEKTNAIERMTNPAKWDSGCLVPLSVKETPLGLLFVDDLAVEMRDTEILELFTSQAAYAFENLRIQDEEKAKKAREQELKIGTQIQESLWPKKIPQSNDIEVYGFMHSAQEIGGDYFDYLYRETANHEITDDIFVSIGDVSGKGVGAGLIMSEVRSFIHALVPFYSSPQKILDLVARLLEKDIWGTGKFMSLLLMLWNSKTKRLEFSSAGHEHIIHYKAKEGICSVFKAGGVVLGLQYKIVSPHLQQNELFMEPNDIIVLFTDGVTEALNEDGDMFSLDRLVECTENYAKKNLPCKEIIEKILLDIQTFAGDCEQSDDITMVGIKRK
ncbi:MAG: SpoIIE family protein phosphatase [Planctomycetes bacterium]|mgnify:FL=1|nr:SpoIIE family protein phosphatase [Planctomycetota bacterium]HON45168.1 fused response regulator/phosphatase [Planctomycetota bacterium]HRU52474.1 fused response regulator/phosphatase [Planctomycetota bacterium]